MRHSFMELFIHFITILNQNNRKENIHYILMFNTRFNIKITS